MRFKNIKPNLSDELHQEQNQSSEIEERQNKKKQPRQLPLEWNKLEPFLEEHRQQQPSEQYLSEFPSRLMPKLQESAQAAQWLRQYLRDTFWQRWGIRLATAMLFLAIGLSLLRMNKDNQQLMAKVEGLEQEISTLQAGM